MEYLFTKFNKTKGRLRDNFILLLLDYDGTLTPIVENPKKAVISEETKELLQKLSGRSNYALGIISGRSLEDIKNTVGIKGIIYAGNHGLEIEGPKIKFKSRVSPRSKLVIGDTAEELSRRLSGIKGVLIEDKGLTLSIHYRLVDKKDMPAFERIFSEVSNHYAARGKIKINSGKKVYEIKLPLQWDKGKAVLWLIARQQFASGGNKVLPVYIGDDVTDEDAFKALKGKGLTIFVGEPGASAAAYYLKDAEEVNRFLRLMLELKR